MHNATAQQKVVVFSQIDPLILQKLQQRFQVVQIHPKQGDIQQQILTAVVDAEGMIGAGRVLDQSNLHTATRLKMISTISVGYDNYDVQYLNQQRIHLAHTPHVLTETTADLAFSLLMSAARRIPELDRWTKQGNWSRTVGAAQFGLDIHGKTLGIIGLGNIGAAIARRGHFGFNMPVVYHNRHQKPELADAVDAQYLSLEALFQHADFIVIAVDLNADSKALIDAKLLQKMKPTAVLINISRGSVVDETALIEALKQKQIFAAGLDVYQSEPLQQSELFTLENVVTLPHVGSATAETRLKMAELAYQNLLDGLAGRSCACLVNPHFE